jgi:hypothetical protein
MGHIYMRLILVLLFSITGCVRSPSNPIFDKAYQLSKAQPEKVTYEYEEKWDPVNNENHLDEKNDCYTKAQGVTKQILIINAEGIVTDVIPNIFNEKSLCFKESYMGFKFPPPPFSPYYMYLQMH